MVGKKLEESGQESGRRVRFVIKSSHISTYRMKVYIPKRLSVFTPCIMFYEVFSFFFLPVLFSYFLFFLSFFFFSFHLACLLDSVIRNYIFITFDN